MDCWENSFGNSIGTLGCDIRIVFSCEGIKIKAMVGRHGGGGVRVV